jgi:hypothetical protein
MFSNTFIFSACISTVNGLIHVLNIVPNISLAIENSNPKKTTQSATGFLELFESSEESQCFFFNFNTVLLYISLWSIVMNQLRNLIRQKRLTVW